jgi:hypothetical protein
MAIGHGWLISLAHSGLCSSSSVGQNLHPGRCFALSSDSGGDRYLATPRHPQTTARARPFILRPTCFTFLRVYGSRPAIFQRSTFIRSGILPSEAPPPPDSSWHHRPVLATDPCVLHRPPSGSPYVLPDQSVGIDIPSEMEPSRVLPR